MRVEFLQIGVLLDEFFTRDGFHTEMNMSTC